MQNIEKKLEQAPAFKGLKIEAINPDPMTSPQDELTETKIRILRKILRMARHFYGNSVHKWFPLGVFTIKLLKRNHFLTRRKNGDWISVTLPTYIDEFLFGQDYKKTTDLISVMDELSQPGTVVIDVGASCGQEVVFLSRAVGESGHVYCFEPSAAFEGLVKTVAANGLKNVTCIRAACGNKNGHLEGQKDDYYFTGYECTYNNTEGFRKTGYSESGEIPVIRLDDFLSAIEETRKLSFVKIDTDGFDVDVIEGLENVKDTDFRILTELVAHNDYNGKTGLQRLAEFSTKGFEPAFVKNVVVKMTDEEIKNYDKETGDPIFGYPNDIVLHVKKAS